MFSQKAPTGLLVTFLAFSNTTKRKHRMLFQRSCKKTFQHQRLFSLQISGFFFFFRYRTFVFYRTGGKSQNALGRDPQRKANWNREQKNPIRTQWPNEELKYSLVRKQRNVVQHINSIKFSFLPRFILMMIFKITKRFFIYIHSGTLPSKRLSM